MSGQERLSISERAELDRAWRENALKMVDRMNGIFTAEYTRTSQGKQPVISSTTFSVIVRQKASSINSAVLEQYRSKADWIPLFEVYVEIDGGNIFKELSGGTGKQCMGIQLDYSTPLSVVLSDLHVKSQYQSKGYMQTCFRVWFEIWHEFGFTKMTIPAAQSPFYKKYLGMKTDNSCSTARAQFEKNRRFKPIRITEELTTSQVLLARSRKKIELARKQAEAKSRQELTCKAQVESRMLKEVDAFVVAVVSKKEKLTGGQWICVSHYDHFRERSLGKIIGWKQKRIDNVILYLRQNRRESVFQKRAAGHYWCREKRDIFTVAKNTGLYVKDVCSRGDSKKHQFGTPGEDVQLTETKSFTRTININKEPARLTRRKEPNSPSCAAEPAGPIASPHSPSLPSSADSTLPSSADSTEVVNLYRFFNVFNNILNILNLCIDLLSLLRNYIISFSVNIFYLFLFGVGRSRNKLLHRPTNDHTFALKTWF